MKDLIKQAEENYAVQILTECVEKLNNAYDQFVINGGVKKDSKQAINNRSRVKDLSEALKLITK